MYTFVYVFENVVTLLLFQFTRDATPVFVFDWNGRNIYDIVQHQLMNDWWIRMACRLYEESVLFYNWCTVLSCILLAAPGSRLTLSQVSPSGEKHTVSRHPALSVCPLAVMLWSLKVANITYHINEYHMTFHTLGYVSWVHIWANLATNFE